MTTRRGREVARRRIGLRHIGLSSSLQPVAAGQSSGRSASRPSGCPTATAAAAQEAA